MLVFAVFSGEGIIHKARNPQREGRFFADINRLYVLNFGLLVVKVNPSLTEPSVDLESRLSRGYLANIRVASIN
jgi:hypothetical protein